MFASSFVSKIDAAVEALPLREAIRYQETNVRVTASEFLVISSFQCRLCVFFRSFSSRHYKEPCRGSCQRTVGAWIQGRRCSCHVVSWWSREGKYATLWSDLWAYLLIVFWIAFQQVTKIAAAKAGLKIVDIDPTITDISSIRESLRQSQAKAIFFFPFYNDVEYTQLLRKAVPEFFHCKSSSFLVCLADSLLMLSCCD